MSEGGHQGSGADAPPWTETDTPLAALRDALRRFNAARDWERFHTPKDLAMALTVEASEVLELFLWRTADTAQPSRERLREELGDVLITLMNLAARLDIDLMAAAQDKLALNARRYPVALARGNALKYDEIGGER